MSESRFEGTSLQQWGPAQEHNPAAPAGAQQAATAAHGVQSGDSRFAGSSLGQWVNESGLAPNAQSWYTGFNAEDTNNGWNTGFTKRFINGQNEAAANGTLNTYFESPHATGVVTWDHTSTDGTKQFKFGDIYDNGKYYGNVYDLYKSKDGSTADADLSMVPWLFDGKQQARMFNNSDPAAAISAAVQAMHEANNVNIPKALSAQDFQESVDKTAADIAEGDSQAAVVGGAAAGGALTGAAAGATIGSVVPGLGTVVGGVGGGIIGGVIGGVGGWLNRDELDQQAARATEITKMAFDENNDVSAGFTALKEWGGFTTKLTSPLTQLVHGGVDTMGKNDAGDGEAGYYATDAKGKSTTPLWAKAANLTATFGDSLAQFINPVGRTVYQVQMGSQIGGELGQLAFTGGETFDPSEGGFDNTFVSDKGKFDPVSGLAELGSVGIDAVQMFAWGGLGRAVGLERAAVEGGIRPVELAGRKFEFDATGKVVSAKRTAAWFAPSEQAHSINAWREARVAAFKDGQRAVTMDDVYRAASTLSTGTRKFKAAMVNAVGEGYEEFSQAILDSYATDTPLDGRAALEAGAYGAAAGLGMGLGVGVGRVSNDAKMSNIAYVNETFRNNGVLPDRAKWDADWAKLSDVEKRIKASRSPADQQILNGVLDRMRKDQNATEMATDLDHAVARDARQSVIDKELMKGSARRTDTFTTMTAQVTAGRVTPEGHQLPGAAPAEAVQGSAASVLRMLINRFDGLTIQEKFLEQRIAENQAKTGDQAAADRVAADTALLERVKWARIVGLDMTRMTEQYVEQIYAADPVTAQRLTADLNAKLQWWYEGTYQLNMPKDFPGSGEYLRELGQEFATLLHAREPKLDAGSFVGLMPQVSWQLTQEDPERTNNYIQVNTDILSSINGDFDGDQLRAENQLILGADRWRQVRAGQYLGGSHRGIDIKMEDFDAGYSQAIAEGLGSVTETGAPMALIYEANGVLANIETAIRGRYGRLMSAAALQDVMSEFRTAVMAGSADARQVLLNALAREAGAKITELGTSSLTNEWAWISRVVRANFQAYQSSYRKLRPQLSDVYGPEGPKQEAPETATPEGINRRKTAATTTAQTLSLYAPGTSLFRKFQKVHYTWFTSKASRAAGAEKADLYDIAALYEELSSGATVPDLVRVRGKDATTTRVLSMLERLVDSTLEDPTLAAKIDPRQALVVLASVKVKDVRFIEDKPVLVDNTNLSLGQLLLARVLEEERAEVGEAAFAQDQKMQARHARLRAMTISNDVSGEPNAERALVEIFEAVPFVEAMGPTTGLLPAHMTPGQWVISYANQSEGGRRDQEHLYTQVPEYLSREQKSNPPYSLAEAQRGEVTAYRTLLDAMMAVGRHAPAERARTNQTTVEDLTQALVQANAALDSYRDQIDSRSGSRLTGAELAREVFNQAPRYGRMLMDLLPKDAVAATHRWDEETGRLLVAPWIYGVFEIADPAEAAFYFWKNRFLAQWRVTQGRTAKEDAKGREYTELQSRLQRLLYEYAREPGQLRFELFMRQLDSAKSLDEFFTWLNTADGMKTSMQYADYLPFVDDVADYEADTAGSWTTAHGSADVRAAIAAARTGFSQMRKDVLFDTAKQATDKALLDSVRAGRDGTGTRVDTENYLRFQRAFAVSQQLPRGFSASAMTPLLLNMLDGIDAHQHDKGKAPDHAKALGEFQARMDAFGFVPDLERTLEVLTAHSIGSLSINVDDLGKRSGLAMDANGREIRWDTLTADDMIDLLDDPVARPLMMRLLTPVVMDEGPAGKVTEKALIEPSMKALLSNSFYKRLFFKGGEDPQSDTTFDRAMTYLYLLDSRSRAEGGGYAMMHAVFDRAVAMTSALRSESKPRGRAAILKEAAYQVAREMQMVGTIQSSRELAASGALKGLRDSLVDELQSESKVRLVPRMVDSEGKAVDQTLVDELVTNLNIEREDRLADLRGSISDPATLAQEVASVEAHYDATEQRILGLLDDGQARIVVEKFHLTGDAAVDAATRTYIAQYVTSMANWPSRAPATLLAWQKLLRRQEPTSAEWEALSQAAMGLELRELLVKAASHITVQPFESARNGDGPNPLETEARYYKYNDPEWKFLVTDLLDEDAPHTAAAVWLHKLADQPADARLSIDQMLTPFKTTVLVRERLGKWTPGIKDQIILGHDTIDRAAAEPAIQAAGNGTKRWAAIGATTSRLTSQEVPDEALLTTVSLTANLLGTQFDPFEEIVVVPTGKTESVQMPLVQLDNRFVKAVRLGGVSVPLDMDNLTARWEREPKLTGYRYLNLERLRALVQTWAKRNNIPLDQLMVELDMFHPDSQPAGAEWMHNAYFEGMSHSDIPDGAESLVNTAWFDNSGLVSVATQWPLDAGKKGLMAVRPFQRPDEDLLAAANEAWTLHNDFAEMLRFKTAIAMTSPAAPPLTSYNAMYKILKLQHIVVGQRDGKPAAMTAEDVIAWQAEHGRDEPLPLDGATLKVLAPDVLRSLVGDTSGQGVPRYFNDEYQVNVDQLPPYTAITEQMLERFPALLETPGELRDTVLARAGIQRVLPARVLKSQVTRDASLDQVRKRDQKAASIRRARLTKIPEARLREGYTTALKLASKAIMSERSSFDLSPYGIPYTPRDPREAEHSARVVEALSAAMDSYPEARGFQLLDEGSLDYSSGVLTVDGVDTKFEKRAGLENQPTVGDIIVLRLDTFDKPGRDPQVTIKRLEKAMRFAVNTGARLAVVSEEGGGDWYGVVADYLQEHGYDHVANAKHLYEPADTRPMSQNQRAYESTLLETSTFETANQVLTFLTLPSNPVGLTENAGIANPKSRKLRDTIWLSNLLRTSAYSNYNIPLEDYLDRGFYSDVLTDLRTLTNPANLEVRAQLVKQAGRDLAGYKPIVQALDEFHARITSRARILPKEGDTIEAGDIIPLVSPTGAIILHRWGMEMLDKMPEIRARQSEGGHNIAIATAKVDEQATANSAIVREVLTRGGYGRELKLELALPLYGDKGQYSFNGFKVLPAPPADDQVVTELLDKPALPNGTAWDMVVNLEAVLAKEAVDGIVFNYRNALAAFQFDFLDDLVEFFYPDPSSRTPQARVSVVSLLRDLARQRQDRIPLTTAAELAHSNMAVADMLGQFAANVQRTTGIAPTWVDSLRTSQSVPGQIAYAVITYLLTDPHASAQTLDNILASGGLVHPRAEQAGTISRRVPGLFADLLEASATSEMHQELISRWSRQLPPHLRLLPDWTLEFTASNGETLHGLLQFGELISSGDNTLLDSQAFHPDARQKVSPHNALAAASMAGATTAHRLLKKTRQFASDLTGRGGVAAIDTNSDLWAALTALPEDDTSFEGWRRETAAETLRKAAAREEIAKLYHSIMDDWTPEQKKQFITDAGSYLNRLNLHGAQVGIVEALIRARLGRSYAVDANGNEVSRIDFDDAREELAVMEQLRQANLLPTHQAHIPLLDINYLTLLYQANRYRENGWAPKINPESETSPVAANWDQWVEAAFGTAFGVVDDPQRPGEVKTSPRFDSVYTLAVDGMMHGYQNATVSTRMLPVSSDLMRAYLLMDPATDRMLVSISADENLRATDPVLFNSRKASLDELITGVRTYAPERDGSAPASAKGQQDSRLEWWRRDRNVPTPRRKTMRGVRSPGQTFLGYTTTTSQMWRSLINLRVGNTLVNPALILAAPLEAWWRRSIDTLADTLVGENAGAFGRSQAKFHDWLASEDAGSVRSSIAGLAGALGLEPAYTVEELQQVQELVNALSQNPDFKAMIYKELMFQYPSMPGIGTVEKWLERYAKFGAKLQDPAWGMLPRDLALIYVKTILRTNSARPLGENIYSLQRMVAEMSANPEWLKDEDLEAHNLGMAAVSNIRSLKPNVFSKAFRGIIEPLAQHDSFAINSAGNFLKMMTMFQNYWTNFAINITGTQGVADLLAMHFDARKKSKIVARMSAAARGEPYTGEDEFFDMTDVLETIDLTDSILRGAVTHTGLFMLGMAAGGLGLSGEDDEEKWRRKQSALQGAGFIHDPRKLANDFRNRDSIFLNWLPMGLDNWFKADPTNPNSEAMAQMNWIARSFLSPIIGFERFYNTGDVTEIVSGFQDAMGSHPIVNQQLWSAAMDTSAELSAAASDAAARGDHVAASHLLLTLVGTLDRLTIENSTINMIYVGRDRYDRDPYKQPRTDSDGNLQVDARQNPTETDVLRPYRADDGSIQNGYVTRDGYGAQARVLTENRFGMAFLGSLFDGLSGGSFTGSDLFRQNMVPKVREIELQPTDLEEIKAYVAAAWAGQQTKKTMVKTLTGDELASIRKDDAKDAGVWVDYGDLERQANRDARGLPMAELSVLKDGREQLTDAGARAVFDGLLKGTVNLGDASLNGVSADAEMRTRIETEWMKDIKQEGIDLGLSPTQASYRMRRIWFGDAEVGATGIHQILWSSNAIPYSNKLSYTQLNTTYVMGPNGFPMATGFTRDGLFGALGVKPLNRAWTAEDMGMPADARNNAVDAVAGINTGLRAIEPRPDGWELPTTEEEIRAAAEKIADAIDKIDMSPTTAAAKTSSGYGGYGYHRYGGGGYSHHGYGGGGGGGGYPYYVRLYALPGGQVPYGNDIPDIYTSNPLIRRADVRRERIWSDRGRLKQWQ